MRLIKYDNYLKYKEFYKREIVYVSDLQGVSDFFRKYPEGIMKKVDGSLGIGINIIDSADGIPDEGFVIEEVLCPDGVLKDLCSALPSVRIRTAYNGQGVLLFQPSIYCNIGNGICSNDRDGRIYIELDMHGNCTGRAMDLNTGSILSRHPDTGRTFDFTLPDFGVPCSMATEIAYRYGGHRILGIDFSYTTRGWVVLEVNNRPLFSNKYLDAFGLRDTFNKAQDFCGYHYVNKT